MISNELLKEKIILKATSGNLIENNEFLIRQNYKEIECHRFNLPQNWIWTTLEEIVDYKNGFAFNSAMMSKNNNGIPVIKSANIGKKKVIINSKTDYIENPTEKMLRCIINKNDILMVLSSQSANIQPLGVSAIYKFETPALLNQRVLKLSTRENVSPDYLLYVINARWFHEKLSNKAAGLAQANLKLSHVLSMEVPLPPLEEQEKIVKKIEELFELIDKKEKNDEEKEKLKTLLKEKILDSAIHGELVKNDLSFPAIDVEEVKADIPFNVPSNWKWTKFDYLATIVRGGSPRPIKDYLTDAPDGINWIKIGDTSSNSYFINNVKEKIKPEGMKKSRFVEKGSLLLSNSMSFGRPYILNVEGCIHDGWLNIKCKNDYFYNIYILYLLSSKYFYNIMSNKSSGSVVSNLNINKVKELIIPIPPLEQQKKIVEKIEECFKLIEQL